MIHELKDKKQDKLDKRAAALKANMLRRKERMKDLKGQKNDENIAAPDLGKAKPSADSAGEQTDHNE